MKRARSPVTFILLLFLSNSLYSQLWKQYSDSAKVYADQRNPEQAIHFYTKAKALITGDSIYTSTSIQLFKNLAILYYSTRQYNEAISTGSELKRVVEKVHTEMNADYAWSCNLLGAIYNINGKLDSAKINHLKAKEIREKLFGNKDPAYAQSCNNLGALYRDMGQYDLAEPLLLEAKDIREKLPSAKQNDPFAITCVSLVIYTGIWVNMKNRNRFTCWLRIEGQHPVKKPGTMLRVVIYWPICIRTCSNMKKQSHFTWQLKA